jgi:glycerol-3-phosphate cytidylyltransferase
MTKVLYTGGTFDLFHAGHINFLRHCKKLADTVVVALNTDEFIKEYKGTPPVCNYTQRAVMLESCVYVDKVIKNINGSDSKPSILSVGPDIIAVGSDWAKKDYYAQMQFTQEWLEQFDITLTYIPYTEKISTSLLKEKIKEK